MTIKEQLHQLIDQLPEDKLPAVVVFLQDLQQRPKAAPRLPAASIMGKYAHVLTSSDEFARRKQEEIELEDRRRRA